MAKLPKAISALIDEVTQNDYSVQKKNKPIELGSICLYYYPNPKYEATLPVFDMLPYVFIMGGDSKYLFGLNVHYFSWAQRLQFMKYLNAKKGKLRYEDIKKAFKAGKIPLGLARYCYRVYLISHIKSNIRLFDLTDDEEFKDAYRVAQHILPKFKGKSDSAVFNEIRANFKASQAKNKK